MKKIYPLVLITFMSSCGALKFNADPLSSPIYFENKKAQLSDLEKKHWHLLDLIKDSVPGMSVERAYEELIKGKKGSSVIVAVIDSGVDINHPELKDNIWVNEDEIPNNGIDDVENGFIDDINGWNFLGNCEQENMEYVRLQKKENPLSDLYKKFEKQRQRNIKEKIDELSSINELMSKAISSDSIIKNTLGKENYSLTDVENFSPKTFKLVSALLFLRSLQEMDLTILKLKDYKKTTQTSIDKHYSLDFNPRTIVGDNPDDLNDLGYGDNNVIGPFLSGADHGTHVSGIIASNRNDNSGSKGIYNNLKIMVLRAVPDGDEYDKDVALAIRYAVDNGCLLYTSPSPRDS